MKISNVDGLIAKKMVSKIQAKHWITPLGKRKFFKG